jgi:hypothetical protein
MDERKTDRRGAVRPANQVRVVYDGEPIAARGELIVTGDDGIETVHDIPYESLNLYATPGGARLILKIDGAFITAHAEGPIEYLAEQMLTNVAKLSAGPAHGWVDQPQTKAQEEQAPKFTPDDIKTQPGIRRKR